MLWKLIKLAATAATGAAILGAVVFGADLSRHFQSTLYSVGRTVAASIPIHFQLERARDLLAETQPRMQQNVRLMAEEEVDIASLSADIQSAEKSLGDEKLRLQKLQNDLNAILVREAKFTGPARINAADEKDSLQQADAHLGGATAAASTVAGK